MARIRTAIALLAIATVLATPAAAWTPDFDAAFAPFPHRGPRAALRMPTVAVAMPVSRPEIEEARPAEPRARRSRASGRRTEAGGRRADASSRLTSYCSRPGKTSRSWIRVKGRRYYCPG